jgi:polyadenylation factor subunit 2
MGTRAMIPGPSPWQPSHLDDPPAPPPPDTREEQLQALAAQEKLGHDGKRQRVRARRTVDPFGGLERWKIVRSHYFLLVCSHTV